MFNYQRVKGRNTNLDSHDALTIDMVDGNKFHGMGTGWFEMFQFDGNKFDGD